MALTDKLRAIGDAIRAKNGSTDKYSLTQMPDAINALQNKDIMPPDTLPDYVRQEINRVATAVRNVITDDSIVFLAMSDGHFYGSEGTYSDGLKTNTGNIHAAMALKTLAYLLPVDFVAHLGDISWGDKKTTPEVLKTQIEDFVRYIHEARADLPIFLAIGNHDPGIYYHNAQTDGAVHTLPGEYMYNLFTAKSASENTVFGDTANGGYCYRDFPEKKLRVFLLNTSDSIIKNQSDDATLGSQRAWFANALLNLNGKADATEWSWILLCHYPADYGGTMPLSELLKAYVDGSSITIKDENGTSTTANFSGKNGAKMIAQFHGHVHNFKTAKLSSYATGSAIQYDAHRVCIPNAQYNRENYYSTVGKYTDINFAETVSYPKTPGTAKDTSFVVNVINPTEQVIHSICYGAGYDRAIGYGATVYYGITIDIPNGTVDNEATSIAEGETYSAIFTAKVGYTVESLSGTVGSVDLSTANFVRIADGENGEHRWRIGIPDVSGDIYITGVVTKPLTYTNQVPISIDSSGAVYNGLGYKDMYTLSSSGVERAATTQFTVTGFIPIKKGDVIRIGGSGASRDYAEYDTRLCFYDSSFGFKTVRNGDAWSAACALTTEADGTAVLTPNEYCYASDTAYVRISVRTNASGTSGANGKDLIITINEEID